MIAANWTLVEQLAKEKDRHLGRVADGQVERGGEECRLMEHKWGWEAELAACSGVPGTRSDQASLGVTVYVSSVGMK